MPAPFGRVIEESLAGSARSESGRTLQKTKNAGGIHVKKRIVSFILAMACLCGLGLSAQARQTDLPGVGSHFADVGTAHWAKDDIIWAWNLGLVNGVDEGHFSPDKPVKRCDFVFLLYRLALEPGVEKEGTAFADVPEGCYYYKAVQWAEENSIIAGKTADSFSPNSLITREEAASILFRFFFYDYRLNNPDMPQLSLLYPELPAKYQDRDQVSSYAERPMKWAVGLAGLISGRSETQLAPKGTATRAEAVAMLRRFAKSMNCPAQEYPKGNAVQQALAKAKELELQWGIFFDRPEVFTDGFSARKLKKDLLRPWIEEEFPYDLAFSSGVKVCGPEELWIYFDYGEDKILISVDPKLIPGSKCGWYSIPLK